jgi:hypothetical protein
MIYAQFWHRGTHGKLIPACGSDSVWIIDGRFGPHNRVIEARKALAHRVTKDCRNYEAVTIHSGRTFSDSRCVTDLPLRQSGLSAPSDIAPQYLKRSGLSLREHI